jgi:hypothetical protein
MQDTIETLYEYMLEDGTLCRLLHVDKSEIHNYEEGGGQEDRVVSLDFLGDSIFEVAVTLDEPLYLRTKCGQCGKVFAGNFSVVGQKILCRTCYPTEETRCVSDACGQEKRRLETAASALLQVAKLRGGGEMYYEEFGRYCFCGAIGIGEKGPYQKGNHATSCDDLNIAIRRAERLCVIYLWGESLQLVLDPDRVDGHEEKHFLVSKIVEAGTVASEEAIVVAESGMIGDYRLSARELRWLKEKTCKAYYWLAGQQEIIKAQKGSLPCPT